MLSCFNVQKGLSFSHTACAAAPLFPLTWRETPSGGNTGILAFADHLHALKTNVKKNKKHNRASLNFFMLTKATTPKEKTNLNKIFASVYGWMQC